MEVKRTYRVNGKVCKGGYRGTPLMRAQMALWLALQRGGVTDKSEAARVSWFLLSLLSDKPHYTVEEVRRMADCAREAIVSAVTSHRATAADRRRKLQPYSVLTETANILQAVCDTVWGAVTGEESLRAELAELKELVAKLLQKKEVE